MITNSSTRTPLHYITLFIGMIAFIVAIFSARICFSYELLIGTDKEDSFSYFAGKTICHIVEKNNIDFSCRTVPNQEHTDRLTNLQNGSLDMALADSKMIYDAFNNSGSYRYITINFDNLRLLMPLYRTPVSLVALKDAGINNLGDLAEKRVNSGALRSLQDQIFAAIMRAKDWEKEDFRLFQNLSPSNEQDSLALKSGSVQAFIHIGMHPDIELGRLLAQSRSELIGINDVDIAKMVDSKVGYSRCSIHAGTYPGIYQDLNTMAMETLLITSADINSKIVELVLRTLTEAKRQMQHAHPSLLRYKFGVETLNDSYLHPHPAAIFFFQMNRDRLSGAKTWKLPYR